MARATVAAVGSTTAAAAGSTTAAAGGSVVADPLGESSVGVLALLSTGLSLSLSRADLAAVVVAEPRLLYAKADRASSRFSARPTAMVVVLALLSGWVIPSVVVAEPTAADVARARRRRCRPSRLPPPSPSPPQPLIDAIKEAGGDHVRR
uniref:Uncharacterized protein n=1 Tax=Oryza nivara TaxID=4536 RepID=A0A0E0ID68_ORYNI